MGYTDAQALRLCFFALVSATLLNAALFAGTAYVYTSLIPRERTYTYIGDDFPSQLPLQLPTVGLELTTDADHFSIYDDDEWGTLFPPSDGFTDLGPANRTFLLSFVHQLHCLDVIRVGFVTNRTGFAHHIQHCLRYLRHSVLCAADTTLEPDDPVLNEDGDWVHAAGGVGSIHRCRDWKVLFNYMLDHPSGPVKLEDVQAEK